MTIVLYDDELDDGCYKVRLMLAALHLAHERIPVGSGRLTPALRRLNPRGTLPILTDRTLVLHGGEAIVAFLARRYDPLDRWYPADDPVLFAHTMMWLSFAAEALRPAALARRQAMFEADPPAESLLKDARTAFRVMEDHMTGRGFAGGRWLVGERPTVSDIVLYPAFALSRDAGIEHDAYPALRRWARRFRSIPGFTTMPGIPDYY